MNESKQGPLDVLIVALPETAGSALYGMVDVLRAAGSIWQTLTLAGTARALFRVQIVAPERQPFTCGNDIPVAPDCSIADNPRGRLLILPEIWLGPDEDFHGRYPLLMEWIRQQYRNGLWIYSACSGAVLLAETGLLDGCPATSHWGYQELFRKYYPGVRFQPQPNLVFADHAGRIVTAGGTTSWHDLVLHIIARHGSPGEALRIAKVYLLKLHSEGQLPYATSLRRTPYADSMVRACETWLARNFHEHDALRQVANLAALPDRSLKRRFKMATGVTLINYLQNLRIEEARRLLEKGELALEDIGHVVGYEDASFFRRLFKRRTGLTPGQYRRMFHPVTAPAFMSGRDD